MAYQNEESTLVEYICYPFFNHVIKKSFFGSYVSGIDLIKVEALVYLIGAVLGRALQHKLDILTRLLFVSGTEELSVYKYRLPVLNYA